MQPTTHLSDFLSHFEFYFECFEYLNLMSTQNHYYSYPSGNSFIDDGEPEICRWILYPQFGFIGALLLISMTSFIDLSLFPSMYHNNFIIHAGLLLLVISHIFVPYISFFGTHGPCRYIDFLFVRYVIN